MSRHDLYIKNRVLLRLPVLNTGTIDSILNPVAVAGSVSYLTLKIWYNLDDSTLV